MEDQLIERIAKHKFLKSVPSDQIESAVLTLEKHISNQYEFVEDQVLIIVRRSNKHSYSMNLLDDLLPGLVFAHRYFGKDLPPVLIKKLLNKPQTADTIFELKCMGMFLDKHKLSYEPKLGSGKVLEFKIIPKNFPEIYVECKSQNQDDSEHIKKYKTVINKLMNRLNASAFIKDAWSNGYRTEVFPDRYIHGAEINELLHKLSNCKFSDFFDPGKNITKHILLICVPRMQEPRSDKVGLQTSSITVGDKPTKISHENAHLMISAWNNVNVQARRSQRRLLVDARKKLRDIPKGSLGLICIQTYGAPKFLPDIQKLISQKEYTSTPIVWLNPFHEGKIICRNEFLNVRNYLFKNMLIK